MHFIKLFLKYIRIKTIVLSLNKFKLFKCYNFIMGDI